MLGTQCFPGPHRRFARWLEPSMKHKREKVRVSGAIWEGKWGEEPATVINAWVLWCLK